MSTLRNLLMIVGMMGCFILSSTEGAQAQEMVINYPSDGTFKIVDKNNVDDIQRYINLLNNAHLDQFRYENESRVLAFNDGVKFELYSTRKVYPSDASKVGMIKDPNKGDPVFSIGKVGKADALGVTFPVHEKSAVRKEKN